MFQLKGRFTTQLLLLTFFITSLGTIARARATGAVEGKVVDPLGAVVPGAETTLLQNGKAISTTKTDSEGNFEFPAVPVGHYLIQVAAPGFAREAGQAVNLTAGGTAHVQVTLQIGALQQQIVVSDTGMGLPESQVGASVSVIDSSKLDAINKLDLFDVLRQVPGLAVVQTGQQGGTTSIFARGGAGDFNKVLVDGIPANDIGGAFEFADLAAIGVNQVEVLRGANSVLYGADALGSVIQVTTRRGSTPSPQLTYAADGGNFSTLRQDASFGGVLHHFDYFADFLDFQTANSLPNSTYHNETFSGNFGWQANQRTNVRFTVRHTGTGLGDANALAFYGIPDDAFQRAQDTYLGLKVQNQTTSQWRNSVQITSTQLRFSYDEPNQVGIPYGGNYLGDPVTICGANADGCNFRVAHNLPESLKSVVQIRTSGQMGRRGPKIQPALPP